MSKQDVVKTNGAKREPRDTSAVGLNPVKRDAMGAAMRVLTRITGSDLAEKYNLRQVIGPRHLRGHQDRLQDLGAATRTFNRSPETAPPSACPTAPPRTPATSTHAGRRAEDDRRDGPRVLGRDPPSGRVRRRRGRRRTRDLLKRSAELGITLINIPEEFEGVASERGAVTNSLVAEALAHGDMGLALPILAPSGVAVALTQWGTDSQQKTYLPAFAGENVPAAAVVVSEPRALFDPFALQTKAVRSPSGYKLNGVKSLVPAAGSAELFVVAAELDGRSGVLHRRVRHQGACRRGGSEHGSARRRPRPSGPHRRRGARVRNPRRRRRRPACPRVRRRGPSRPPGLGVARGRHQPGRARLRDPYANEREAFGEPISHRQAVAS